MPERLWHFYKEVCVDLGQILLQGCHPTQAITEQMHLCFHTCSFLISILTMLADLTRSSMPLSPQNTDMPLQASLQAAV